MALMVIGSTTIVRADIVNIPVSIKVDAFKKDMKKNGLDLYGGDDADGEIENHGTSIKVITNKNLTIQQLDLIKDASFRNVRKNNG